MWNAIRCLVRNSILTGIARRAEDYRCSGAAAHCSLRADFVLTKYLPRTAIENWSQWPETDHTEDEKRLIRDHTSTGRPWCTPEMLLQLERITGRKLEL